MQHVIAIGALMALLIGWALVQRLGGHTAPEKRDGERCQGCNSRISGCAGASDPREPCPDPPPDQPKEGK